MNTFLQKKNVAKPLQNVLSQVENFEILNKRSNSLSKVKNHIDINLDPRNFSYGKIIREILSSIEITEDDYYWALSISPKTDYGIQLKRSPVSCFVSNYNPVLLKTWEANLDIQSVLRYSLTYMGAYFSKLELEVSEALKIAAAEIKNQNLNVRDAMKKLHVVLKVNVDWQYKKQYIIYHQSFVLENAHQISQKI